MDNEGLDTAVPLSELVDVTSPAFDYFVQQRKSYLIKYRPPGYHDSTRRKKRRWRKGQTSPLQTVLAALPVELQTAHASMAKTIEELSTLQAPLDLIADASLDFEVIEEKLFLIRGMGASGVSVYGTTAYDEVLSVAAKYSVIEDHYRTLQRSEAREIENFHEATVRDLFND